MLAVLVVGVVFIGLPWLLLHYLTRWKTAATLTSDDEQLLEELYRLARRLDERMDTVERLVATEHPEFQPRRLPRADPTGAEPLHELDLRLARKDGR